MRPEPGSGDAVDTAEQYLCQPVESVSGSPDNDERGIEAVACPIFVQATNALHSDWAFNLGITTYQ